MKIPSVRTKQLDSDGKIDRRDKTKLIFAFRNFANAAKNTIKYEVKVGCKSKK